MEKHLNQHYTRVSSEGAVERGKYLLGKRELLIGLRHGKHPFNSIGIDRQGNIIVCMITGLGKRVGVTLEEIAQTIHAAGAVQAIRLDGGADVQLWFNEKPLIPSCAGRDRLNSVIMFVTREST